MTPEQERVSSILLDTVALLCKNSLSFTTELKVQGLIGITMDGSDVFLVQINELFHSEAAAGSSVKQERAEVGAHQTPNPSQTFNERRATPQKRQPAALRKPVSRPLYSQSNRSNQMAEEVEAYHLNQNIKSEVGYDDPTSSTFGEYGYAENTVMAPPTSSSKVKPISMMRQTQVTYGSGASSSTVASTIVTEAFNMLDEGEEEEEEGLGSQDDHMEQVDEMPKWDPTSGDGLYQHHLDQSQLNPVAPAAQMMWTGAMTTPRSSGFGFSHKVKTIESQKEKEHIIIDGFRYRKDRVNTDGSASWRCAARNCKGRLKVATDDSSTLVSEHSHASNLELSRARRT